MTQVERLDTDVVKISGVLDFSTVTACLKQINALCATDQDVLLDFTALEHVNSAGLALLLELLAEARKQNRNIRFSGIPKQLNDLARMSNVEYLLAG